MFDIQALQAAVLSTAELEHLERALAKISRDAKVFQSLLVAVMVLVLAVVVVLTCQLRTIHVIITCDTTHVICVIHEKELGVTKQMLL
jgi:uncharacterized membrane protein YjjP (DUF1212 family)